MKMDLANLKAILDVFVDSDKSFVKVASDIIPKYPVGCLHNFSFHYLMLVEEGYICAANSRALYNASKAGFSGLSDLPGDDCKPLYFDAEVSLTKSGFEFASALGKPDIFERLKEISSEPISVIKDVSKELAVGYIKQKCGISV
ncbi:hypothetical protein [Aeromonas caviae]|jgi:hypothetical protein|uniref:hypothetical protein n=1 Tax=Aeromonas caviae TaxID=648 RepID=UPI000B137F4B|nr:hypothetical protein [Aeromonas caviae]MDH1635773.1 hypothetical protein [Aeromonas caviae]